MTNAKIVRDARLAAADAHVAMHVGHCRRECFEMGWDAALASPVAKRLAPEAWEGDDDRDISPVPAGNPNLPPGTVPAYRAANGEWTPVSKPRIRAKGGRDPRTPEQLVVALQRHVGCGDHLEIERREAGGTVLWHGLPLHTTERFITPAEMEVVGEYRLLLAALRELCPDARR